MKKALFLGIQTCLLMASLAQHRSVFKTHSTKKIANEHLRSYTARLSAVPKQTLDSVVTQQYDSSTETWVPSTKYLMQYNDQQLQSRGISYDLYEGNFAAYLEEEFSYDTYGRLIQKKEIGLGVEAQFGDRIIYYKYNPQGLLAVDSTIDLKNQSLTKTEYSYGPNQKILSEKSSRYNIAAEIWYQEKFSLYAYNEKGLVDSLLIRDQNDSLDMLIVYEYDAKGQNIRMSDFYRLNRAWQLTYINEYTYDDGGNVIEVVSSYRDSQTQTLKYEYKNQYDVDLSVPKDQLVWVKEADELFNHKLTDLRSYTFIGGQWVLREIGKAYYSQEVVTQANDLALAQAEPWYDAQNSILYLPSQDQGDLQLYDLQGRTALQKQTSQSSVSLQDMSPGCYSYRWVAQGQIMQGRIIR